MEAAFGSAGLGLTFIATGNPANASVPGSKDFWVVCTRGYVFRQQRKVNTRPPGRANIAKAGENHAFAACWEITSCGRSPAIPNHDEPPP